MGSFGNAAEIDAIMSRSRLPSPRPAPSALCRISSRMAVGVSGLPYGVAVEVEAVFEVR
jgi:hypothetical protein